MEELRETIPFRSALIPIVDALESLCKSIWMDSWIISWGQSPPDFMPDGYLPVFINQSDRFDESEATVGALRALERARKVIHAIDSLPEGSPSLGAVSTIREMCDLVIHSCETFLSRKWTPPASVKGTALVYIDSTDPYEPIVYNYYHDRFNVFDVDYERLRTALDRVKKMAPASDRRISSPQDPGVEGRASAHCEGHPMTCWEHWPHREIGMQIWEELRIATIEGRLLKRATCLANWPKGKAHNWKRLIPPQLHDLIECQQGKGSKLKDIENASEIASLDTENGRETREKCGANPISRHENT